MDEKIFLCSSGALIDAQPAVPFDVIYEGLTCRAFAVRHKGHVQAYLNRCAHIPMEMDYQANRFFDESGKWLLCATHGAVYKPETGECVEGPCRGNLVKITLSESDGNVYWHTTHNLKIFVF
jgi:nitrite reductase/ring-hydroxylating ferredoxin subunit